VEAGMHTQTARQMGRRRTAFLRAFLEELRLELEESGEREGEVPDSRSPERGSG
jgi:hypothetical protein